MKILRRGLYLVGTGVLMVGLLWSFADRAESARKLRQIKGALEQLGG